MLNRSLKSRTSRARKAFGLAALFLMLAVHASAQLPRHPQIKFVNVADSTQGLSDFSQFPAINNRGAVAFLATPNDSTQSVLRWDRQGLRSIASTTQSEFTSFSDDVVINRAGVVGFRAGLGTVGRAAGIFTGDGITRKTIVNSIEQGLPGFGIGTPSINDSGTVAFSAFRNGFRSAVIFTGEGGPLTPVLDTLTSDFISFGAAAINASGKIVFSGIQTDQSEGIFVISIKGNDKDSGNAAVTKVIDIVDTNNPDFFDFGDPVISDSGTVADSGGGPGGAEIFSGSGNGITARTDPTSGTFAEFEHPSINQHGAVAFSAFEANFNQGIFVELTGGALPVTVLQSGDSLFGSTVTAVSVGRFAFNDHFQLAFGYELADGRTGIAIAKLQGDNEGPGEDGQN